MKNKSGRQRDIVVHFGLKLRHKTLHRTFAESENSSENGETEFSTRAWPA